MKLFRRFRGLVAGSATAATLTLGLVAVALQFSSPASAQGEANPCAEAVTSAPDGEPDTTAWVFDEPGPPPDPPEPPDGVTRSSSASTHWRFSSERKSARDVFTS